jgi:hypothetical protein
MRPQDQKKSTGKEESDFGYTQEYFDWWLNTYKATMARLLEIPAVGPAREKSEKMMKGLSAFSNLYAAGMDITSDLQRVFTQAMLKVQEKTANDMGGEISPGKYKEFYNIWIETYSETFKEFSKSDHFVSDLGKFNSYLIDFQQYNREMLEENYLKPMNLPTKTEIDEINKELYFLKKKVKEMARQIKELKNISENPSNPLSI